MPLASLMLAPGPANLIPDTGYYRNFGLSLNELDGLDDVSGNGFDLEQSGGGCSIPLTCR